MHNFVKQYAFNKYSQNGEDGIISEIIKRIHSGPYGSPDEKKRKAVEFGAADGFWLSNTAYLPPNWERKLFDSEAAGNVEKAFITPQNVNQYVLPNIDLLSIDIDGNDYNVWKSYQGIPDIVVIEINSDHDDKCYFFGAGTSYRPMVDLGIAKGYFLVCHTGNLIFVRKEYRDKFPDIQGDGLSNSELYFNTSWLQKK
jgi:hypothetical protein